MRPVEEGKMTSIPDSVTASLNSAQAHPHFTTKLSAAASGATVIFTNSFFARKKSATRRSGLHLVRRRDMTGGYGPPHSLRLDNGIADVLKVSTTTDSFTLTALPSAVEEQLRSFGDLAFLLVGAVDGTQDTEFEIGGLPNRIKSVVWRPTVTACAVETDGTFARLIVPTVDDEAGIVEFCRANGHCTSDDHKTALLKSLDAIRQNAVSRLELPPRGTAVPDGGFLDQIVTAMRRQMRIYDDASSGLVGAPPADILRIAYNVASDALQIVQLCLAVHDLKPLVQWLTIHSSSALFDRLHALLPYSTAKKPDLELFASLVKDARNREFHNALPYVRTLESSLPSSSIRAVQVRFMSEFGRSGENRMRFEDDELLDLLFGITRAKQRPLPLTFWSDAGRVMHAMVDLVEATSSALKRIRHDMPVQHPT
jgi:hypothetical protein